MERNPAVADTGFIVALLNRSDTMHSIVVTAYTQQQQILLPQTVLAEVAYLVGRNAGVATVAAFLKGLSASKFSLVALTDQDVMRVAEILEDYGDTRIDFVDATVMAVAERYGITKILTLDQRDFRLFRPKHCDSFEILP
ncbi:type II toxin-antitoxin system VapC family toxin [Fischerella sp. PCC 9605]|uniref:type II toxin-antitoxin system VapC family toxin n=1 Tax=Fischerella sp. PCC 9605 TaxID=1173024 RepID=UPI00047B0138|nr:PIN domain-containing protein [Fischerella sp. PCC 9605]